MMLLVKKARRADISSNIFSMFSESNREVANIVLDRSRGVHMLYDRLHRWRKWQNPKLERNKSR